MQVRWVQDPDEPGQVDLGPLYEFAGNMRINTGLPGQVTLGSMSVNYARSLEYRF